MLKSLILTLVVSAAAGFAATPVLVKEIKPGPAGVWLDGASVSGETVFIPSDLGLWRTDGTTAATVNMWSEATYKVARDESGRIFFIRWNADLGYELWITDGTLAGSRLVKDIYPGWRSSEISGMVASGTTMYFTANDGVHGTELWKSDGTPDGTVMVRDITPPNDSYPYPIRLTAFDGAIFFVACTIQFGCELYRSDGTSDGTVQVTDLNPGTSSSSPTAMTVIGEKLYFTGSGPKGYEPYTSDGTSGGTVLLRDIHATSSSMPHEFVEHGGFVYFDADDGLNGRELWRTDGTTGGTVRVTDINPGAGASMPGLMSPLGEQLLFSANDGVHGFELWKLDGGSASLVKDIYEGPSNSLMSSLWFVYEGRGYFRASDAANGSEIWSTDGTESGTYLSVSIRNGIYGSDPRFLAILGGTVIFTATDGVLGSELWRASLCESAPPTNLVAESGATSVQLSWSESPTAATYSIYRARAPLPGATYAEIATVPSSTTWYEDYATPNMTYSYKVAAVSSSGCESLPTAADDAIAGCGIADRRVLHTGPSTICPGVASAATVFLYDAGPNETSHQWGYRSQSGGTITPLAGRVGSSYNVDARDFPGSGDYFLVCTSGLSCGANVVSEEAPVTISPSALPEPMIYFAWDSSCPGAQNEAFVDGVYDGYLWTIENGTITSDPNDRMVYFTTSPNGGTTVLQLTVTIEPSCTSASTRSVTEKFIPAPDLQPYPDTVCPAGEGYVYADTTGDVLSYVQCDWSVENATITLVDGQSMWYRPTGAGPVAISVDVVSDEGCAASASTVVPLATIPPPAIYSNPPEVCPDIESVAWVEGNGGAIFVEHQWSIQNGEITFNDDSSILFKATGAGPVEISIAVVDSDGCSSATSVTVPLSAPASCPDTIYPVAAFSVTSRENASTPAWRNPLGGSYSATVLRRRSDGTYPQSGTDGDLVADQADPFGALQSVTDAPLVPGTTYKYAAFVRGTSGVFSAGRYVSATPLSPGSRVAWVYNTGAAATTPVGVFTGRSFISSNDRFFHSFTNGTNGGGWPSEWRPLEMNAPAQSRTLPLDLPIGGVTRNVVLVSSQDGRVYCVDSVTGSLIWNSPRLGEMMQGAATAISSVYGAPFSLVFAATRNSETPNKVYALNPDNGSVVWAFDNSVAQGGDGLAIGPINDAVIFEYAADWSGKRRAFFASRAMPGGSADTLWAVKFDSATVSRSWSQHDLGAIDGFPFPSGELIAAGDVNGNIGAYSKSTGGSFSFAPYRSGDGPVKVSVIPDAVNNRFYFSTTNSIRAVAMNSFVGYVWKVDLPSPSFPNLYQGRLYVGAGDGKLYQIENVGTATSYFDLVIKSISLGDPLNPPIVGVPTIDRTNNIAYVGTDSGAVYAVALPLQ